MHAVCTCTRPGRSQRPSLPPTATLGSVGAASKNSRYTSQTSLLFEHKLLAQTETVSFSPTPRHLGAADAMGKRKRTQRSVDFGSPGYELYLIFFF